MATSNVTYGPLVQKLSDPAQGSPGVTSGNVPITDPGQRREVLNPTQGNLSELGMEEGYRNPLPGVPGYLQMRPLYGGAPTA